jgi:hypothetical protein
MFEFLNKKNKKPNCFRTGEVFNPGNYAENDCDTCPHLIECSVPKPMNETKGSYVPPPSMVFPPKPPPKNETNFETKIEIKTHINFDAKTIELDSPYPFDTDRVVREFLDTKEKAVKEALIKLGWTPPQK